MYVDAVVMQHCDEIATRKLHLLHTHKLGQIVRKVRYRPLSQVFRRCCDVGVMQRGVGFLLLEARVRVGAQRLRRTANKLGTQLLVQVRVLFGMLRETRESKMAARQPKKG